MFLKILSVWPFHTAHIYASQIILSLSSFTLPLYQTSKLCKKPRVELCNTAYTFNHFRITFHTSLIFGHSKNKWETISSLPHSNEHEIYDSFKFPLLARLSLVEILFCHILKTIVDTLSGIQLFHTAAYFLLYSLTLSFKINFYISYTEYSFLHYSHLSSESLLNTILWAFSFISSSNFLSYSLRLRSYMIPPLYFSATLHWMKPFYAQSGQTQ